MKIAIFGHKNWSLAKVHEVTHNLFLPQGIKIELIFAHGQQFPRYRQIFKIAIFGHETLLLAKYTRVAHILQILIYFKIAIFGHKTWSLTKDPEVAHILSFYPRGSKFSIFSLYGKQFPRYGGGGGGGILKITILGMKLGHWPKVPEVACLLSFYHSGSKLSFFSLSTGKQLLSYRPF